MKKQLPIGCRIKQNEVIIYKLNILGVPCMVVVLVVELTEGFNLCMVFARKKAFKISVCDCAS